MSTATGEATTLGAALTAAQALDDKAQSCEQTGELCARGAEAMTQSQGALDAALIKFQLDRRTLAASKLMQEATHGLEEAAAHVGGSARALSELSKTLLERLGGHRRLAQAVQEHGEAAQMGWYGGGR